MMGRIEIADAALGGNVFLVIAADICTPGPP